MKKLLPLLLLLSSYTLNAQSIKNEAAFDGQELTFDRKEISVDGWTITYDWYKSKDDVSSVTLGNDTDFGGIYKIGDTGKNDLYWGYYWKKFNSGEFTFEVDGGLGLQHNNKPTYFIRGDVKNDDFSLEATWFGQELNRESFFGYVGWNTDNTFVSIGTAGKRLMSVSELKGFEDFGMFNYALYNPDTKVWTAKSQIALSDANQGFFTRDLVDLTSELFSTGTFHAVHFSPVMTKGEWTVKAYGHGDENETELEGMIGYANPLLDVGIGVNHKRNNLRAVIEAYKGVKWGDLGVHAEVRYIPSTDDVSGYVTLQLTR